MTPPDRPGARDERMASVFLSYRREDARADAGRLHDRLSASFGADSVFMDIDDIAAGDNFVERLKQTLDQCDVLLLVIGPRWHSITDAEGRPRLASPSDFVRLEVQTALERDIPLIPVLVGGATMPTRAEVPSQLADVVLRQSIQISDERFHEDVDRLTEAIRRVTRARLRRPLSRRPLTLLTLLALAAVVAAAIVLLVRESGEPAMALRSTPASVSSAEARAMVVAKGFHEAAWNAAARGPAHAYATRVEGDAVLIADDATGLVWEKGGSGRPVGYEDALARVQEMAARRVGGHADWRLPTVEEAASLLAPAAAPPGIDPTSLVRIDPAFEFAAAPFVWTADNEPDGRRWVVYYGEGRLGLERDSYNAYVRAVRGP
jgi:hypothetical protein